MFNHERLWKSHLEIRIFIIHSLDLVAACHALIVTPLRRPRPFLLQFTQCDESWRAVVGVNRIAINLKPASEIVSAAGVGTTFYYDLWGKAGAMLAGRCGSLGSLQPLYNNMMTTILRGRKFFKAKFHFLFPYNIWSTELHWKSLSAKSFHNYYDQIKVIVPWDMMESNLRSEFFTGKVQQTMKFSRVTRKIMIKKILYQIGWECIGNFAEKWSWSHFLSWSDLFLIRSLRLWQFKKEHIRHAVQI